MLVKLLGICICFLCFHVNIGYAATSEDGCLMDNSAIGKPTIFSSKDFLKSEWNDKEKVASFLTTKHETLTVKYSACENFGVDAELGADASNSRVLNKDYIADRIKWLAWKMIGKPEELKLVEDFVRGKLFGLFFVDGIYNRKQLVFDIPSDRYSEAFIQVEISKGRLLISLSTVAPG